MKELNATKRRLIDQTRKVWQPRFTRTLTDEDARQIAENVTGFFEVLAEWSRASKSACANDALMAPTPTAIPGGTP